MSAKSKGKVPLGKHEIPPDIQSKVEAQGAVLPPNRRSRNKRSADMELDKAFSYLVEEPVQHITLPSKGILYDGLPDGKLEVVPLTAREEKLLAGASGDVTDVIETLFKRCVVLDNGMTPGDFLSSDRFYTLLMLRANSYGEEYSFSITCDYCGFDFIKSINIPGDLEIRYINDEAVEPFEVVLPRSGKRVGFRLPRGYDEVAISRYTERLLGKHSKRKRVARDKGDQAYLYRIARLIVTLDGYDVSDESLINRKMEFVEKMIGADSITLQEAVAENDCGVDTTMSERCPRCNKTNQFMMPFTAEFFRPPGGVGE